MRFKESGATSILYENYFVYTLYIRGAQLNINSDRTIFNAILNSPIIFNSKPAPYPKGCGHSLTTLRRVQLVKDVPHAQSRQTGSQEGFQACPIHWKGGGHPRLEHEIVALMQTKGLFSAVMG